MAAARVLLEDRLTVKGLDSSKFERVTRISGRSAAFDAEVTIDINSSIYPIKEEETFTFAFADHGARGAPSGGGAPSKEMTKLMDEYEYVCHGKVFNEEDKGPDRRAVYISFGGLLCQLIADKAIVSEFVLDKNLFFLLRHSN